MATNHHCRTSTVCGVVSCVMIEEAVRLVIGEGDFGGGGEVCHSCCVLLPLFLLLHVGHNLVQTGQLLTSAPCTHTHMHYKSHINVTVSRNLMN